jgi:hypothetical protein
MSDPAVIGNESSKVAGPSMEAAHGGLDRRQLLLAVTTLAAALGLPGAGPSPTAAEAPIGVDAFRDLTVALTGYTPRERFLAQDFLDAFAPEAADLARLHGLVRNNPPDAWEPLIAAAGLSNLAEALVSAWFTGMVGEGSERRVLSYLGAFVWYACGYTKPPTQCDWDFGAWADAPPPGRYRG